MRVGEGLDAARVVEVVVREDHRVDVGRVDADPLQHDVGRLPVADAVAIGQDLAELGVVEAGVDDREVVLALERPRSSTAARGGRRSSDRRARRRPGYSTTRAYSTIQIE